MDKITINSIRKELKVIDPEEKKFIKKNISTPMSDQDLINELGSQFRDNIFLYSDLQKYNSITELLPTDKSFKILLVRDQPNSGHYVVILRYGDTIEWFDSFGLYPSNELNYIDSNENQQLGQTKGLLKSLLDQAINDGFQVVYNKLKMQEFSTDNKVISVCGRFCCLRIIMLLKYNYDLRKFLLFMEDLRKNYRLSYDELVSLIIK